MDAEGLDLISLSEMLEAAEPSGEARKEGIVEMVAHRGGKSYKIVVAESLRHSTNELVNLMIHVKGVRG